MSEKKKKNVSKKIGIGLAITVVILSLLGYGAYKIYKFLLPSDAGVPVYLERTEDLPVVTENVLLNAEGYLREQDGVLEVDVRVQGPIIYTDLKVADEMLVDDVKALFALYFDVFSETYMNTYDFQFIVIKGNEVADEEGKKFFPMFGAKPNQNLDSTIMWNSRYVYLDTIVVEEEEETEE